MVAGPNRDSAEEEKRRRGLLLFGLYEYGLMGLTPRWYADMHPAFDIFECSKFRSCSMQDSIYA